MNAGNRKVKFLHWANIITLFRLVLSIVYLALVHFVMHSFQYGKELICLFCCILLIWVSDFCDGKVARVLNTESVFGQYFDVAVDFFYVFTSHLQLAIYGIMPWWFLIVIVERITNYILTSYIQNANSKSLHFFVKDTVGKYVSAAFFVTPIIMCVLHKTAENGNMIIIGLLWFLTMGSAVSTLTRFYKVHTYKRVRRKKEIICE